MILNPTTFDISPEGVLNVAHKLSFGGNLILGTPADTELRVTVYRDDGSESPCRNLKVRNVSLQEL